MIYEAKQSENMDDQLTLRSPVDGKIYSFAYLEVKINNKNDENLEIKER